MGGMLTLLSYPLYPIFNLIYWREYNVNITNRPNPGLSIGHIHVCTNILEELLVCRFLAYFEHNTTKPMIKC
jgi:hypothetical protein